MVEQGETENLKFICYYHLIISTMSTSLISLDTFFVTDSDRRKSVIELEKIKIYYEKSLLLESQIKESNVILDTEKFEDRMQINYEINNIINEFWGYNEIKKYYEHNQKVKERMKLENGNKPKSKNDIYNNDVIDESISNLAIYNSLDFSNINSDEILSNSNINDTTAENEKVEIISNDNERKTIKTEEFFKRSKKYNKNDSFLLDNKKNKVKNVDLLSHNSKSNLLNDKSSHDKGNKKILQNKTLKIKNKLNKSESLTLTESLRELKHRNSSNNINRSIHHKSSISKNNYIKEYKPEKQTISSKPKVRVLQPAIVPGYRPLSHHGELFKSTFIPLSNNNL